MSKFRPAEFFNSHRSLILWLVIAIYTFLLPNAIVVYRALEARFGQAAAGKIPLVTVILVGLGNVIFGYRQRKNFCHLLYLAPAALIALAIIKLEPNPNKHIHIPEYVLMACLLYAVLHRDTRGWGLFGLIFLLGAMLGVVDELEQGLHPRRFYGWSDMLVNASSVLIGILILKGNMTSRHDEPNRGGGTPFETYPSLWGLFAFGFSGAVLMAIRLFDVQAQEMFWGVYPGWLLGWGSLYWIGCLLLIFPQGQKLSADRQIPRLLAAQYWLLPGIVILGVMHTIPLLVVLGGLEFR